tara:strand:- start:548 stop:1195 length:648 start_codon:yes stop_codon:yes gene_type:complete
MTKKETAGQLEPVEVPADFKKKGLVEVLRGKDYINHKGIVKLLHMHGVMCITAEPVLELCSVENRYFTFKCEIVGTRCSVTMYGDASPANVSKGIASACSRMAETRAINRAGRTYLGLGQTTFDEMPDVYVGGVEDSPQEQAPTPNVHDPSFGAEQKDCFRELGELKMDYEVVKVLCASKKWPPLSGMGSESRTNVLAWLKSSEGLKAYKEAANG